MFMDEVSREEKNNIIDTLHLNHHKYRYIIIPLSFDFHLYEQQGIIQKGNHHLIIQYNGVTKAEMVNEDIHSSFLKQIS